MICPVEIARDVSALQAARVGDHGKHGFLLEGRGGAGDESTGSDFAGHGEEDYMVAGGPRSSASATDGCGAGMSATKSLAMTGCSTGGAAGSRAASHALLPSTFALP